MREIGTQINKQTRQMTAPDIIRETGQMINLKHLCEQAGVSYYKVRRAIAIRGYELKPTDETALKAELFKLLEVLKSGIYVG